MKTKYFYNKNIVYYKDLIDILRLIVYTMYIRNEVELW